MGNPIKYSATVTSGSYQKGNNAIGVNPIGYGPTATTGWYNSPTPTGGNFIVTEVVDGNTPPRFYSPTTDNEWLRLARQEGATGANTGSTTAIKNWFASQANYVVTNIDFPTTLPSIVGDGLVLNLDAKINASYPGSGTTWTDISGLGNNGILTNGPIYSNQSIVFDGTNDYVQVTSPFGNIDWSTKAWSFSAFMKLDTLGDKCLVNLNSANAADYIVTNVFYTDQKSYWYFINNNLSVQTNFTQTTGNFPTNQIFHFTMTYNGNGLSSGNIKFYKNGNLLTTTEGGSAGLGNISGLQIGGTYYPLDGNVYNFLMYNKVLSQTEVLQNYYQGNIVTDGLVISLDAGNLVSYESGSTLTYSLTGSASGSLINGTGYTSSFGGGWIFDGVDDRIQINTNLSISSSFTINYTVLIKELPTTNEYNYIFLNGVGYQNNGVYAEFGDGPFFSICTVNSSSAAGAVYLSNPQANVVYYATATYENRTLKGYINGNLVNTNNLNFDPVNGSNNTLNIGAHGPFVIPLWGYYNRALTAAEVQQNFNAQRSRFGI